MAASVAMAMDNGQDGRGGEGGDRDSRWLL